MGTRESHVQFIGLDTEGHSRRSESEGYAVDTLSTSEEGRRRTWAAVIERWEGMVGGQGSRTFPGRSDALEETEGLFMEGRARNSVDPERIGVGLPRQTGRKEDGGLSAQRRHLAGEGKSV